MLEALDGSSKGILYLAGPYSHPDPDIREGRYRRITAVAAQLISRGRIVYSPLTMTHPIDKLLAGHTETLGSEYWVNFDESFMEFCSDIAVVMIDGWDKSSGVAREVKFFSDRGRPVHYIRYEEDALVDF
jgi:hypothetical protein